MLRAEWELQNEPWRDSENKALRAEQKGGFTKEMDLGLGPETLRKEVGKDA